MHAHFLTDSDYESYQKCSICGSLFHRNPTPPDELYLDGKYWNGSTGKSDLISQIYNCAEHRENGVTKNEFILSRIKPFSKRLLEVGCAPGSTLRAILDAARAESVTGIEPDDTYLQQILETIGYFYRKPEFLTGYFPEITGQILAGTFDQILAIDTFEHCFDGPAFLAECSRLLNKHGELFLMLPLVDDDGTIYCERMLVPEHPALYSFQYMEEMLTDAGFGDVIFDRWTDGHETVSATKE